MKYYLKLFLINIVSVVFLHAVVLKLLYNLGAGIKGLDSMLTIVITPLALCWSNYVMSKGRSTKSFIVNATMILAAVLISNYLSDINWRSTSAAYADDAETQGVYGLFTIVQAFFTIIGITGIFIAKKFEERKLETKDF